MKPLPAVSDQDGRYLQVAEDTSLKWTYQGVTYRRTLPEGYKFRPGASVETIVAFALVGRPYALQSEVALHDYLYDEMENAPDDAVPRVVADAVFLQGDPGWFQKTVHTFVRALGFIPWLQ